MEKYYVILMSFLCYSMMEDIYTCSDIDKTLTI